jgi:SecD/SecF fusion protein
LCLDVGQPLSQRGGDRLVPVAAQDNTAASGGLFRSLVNRALLQTVPRTVNTGLGAMFILGALAVLGGDSLTDFAVALLIGIAVGTYSSMFTASPLAIELQARSNTPPPRRRGQPAARAASGRARPAPAEPIQRRAPRDTGAGGSRTP